MMSEVLQYLIMITCILIRVSSKEVKWTVRDTSIKLGQDLTLFCEVDNCTVHETKRWQGGPDDKVLMLYNGNSNDKAKYSTSIEKNGFILTILNLTVKDLNVSYECSCGVDSDKHSLHIEDVDTVDNLNKTINGTSYIGTNDVGGIPWYGILLIIIAVIVVIFVAITVIKRRRRNSAPVHKPTDEDLQRSDADDDQNVTIRLLENTELHSNPSQCSDADDDQNVTIPLLEHTELDSNPRQCSDADDDQNVTIPLLEHTELDSNPRQCSGSSLPPVLADSNLGQSSGSSLPPVVVDSNQRQSSDEVDSQNVADPLSQTTNVDSNLGQSSDAESFEPSTSEEASSESQRTSSSITGTERRESLETNPNTPDSSFQYSNNHRDVPASTCPGKRHMEYANIKLREKSFKTWPLKKPTILQLAKAGFFHLGYQNIAQCFSCGNKITWEEDWNPLDEVFHNNCEHLRQITST